MFFFRTEYVVVRNNSISINKGSNTYCSYVLAKDKSEALVKIANRNLNESLMLYSHPVPLEKVSERDLVDALKYFDKRQFQYALHAVTFMVFVLGKAGLINPIEAIADTGVLHELMHLISYPHLCDENDIRNSIKFLQDLYYELSH